MLETLESRFLLSGFSGQVEVSGVLGPEVEAPKRWVEFGAVGGHESVVEGSIFFNPVPLPKNAFVFRELGAGESEGDFRSITTDIHFMYEFRNPDLTIVQPVDKDGAIDQELWDYAIDYAVSQAASVPEGKMFVFDYERKGFHDDTPQGESLRRLLKEAIIAVKLSRPDLPVSAYGIMPLRSVFPSIDEAATDRVAFDLYGVVDFILPSWYWFYPEGQTADAIQVMNDWADEAERINGQFKPIVPLLWPRLHSGGLFRPTPDVWLPERGYDTSDSVSATEVFLPNLPNRADPETAAFYYVATTPGISGEVEPEWPTQLGETVIDGSVTWVARAARWDDAEGQWLVGDVNTDYIPDPRSGPESGSLQPYLQPDFFRQMIDLAWERHGHVAFWDVAEGEYNVHRELYPPELKNVIRDFVGLGQAPRYVNPEPVVWAMQGSSLQDNERIRPMLAMDSVGSAALTAQVEWATENFNWDWRNAVYVPAENPDLFVAQGYAYHLVNGIDFTAGGFQDHYVSLIQGVQDAGRRLELIALDFQGSAVMEHADRRDDASTWQQLWSLSQFPAGSAERQAFDSLPGSVRTALNPSSPADTGAGQVQGSTLDPLAESQAVVDWDHHTRRLAGLQMRTAFAETAELIWPTITVTNRGHAGFADLPPLNGSDLPLCFDCATVDLESAGSVDAGDGRFDLAIQAQVGESIPFIDPLDGDPIADYLTYLQSMYDGGVTRFILDNADTGIDLQSDFLISETIDIWLDGGGITVGLPGDANLDGSVDLLDLDILGQNWQGAGTWSFGDFNGDQIVNLIDLDILGSGWGSVQLPGDANRDGVVNLIDLDILGGNWLQAGIWSSGDFNDDGVVDLLDLDLLGQSFT